MPDEEIMLDQKGLFRFREELLGLTIKNALKTDFYRRLWQEIEVGEVSPDNLFLLPVVYKSDLIRESKSARVLDGQICSEHYTGGTTGEPFSFLLGEREKEYLSEFYKQVNKAEYKVLGRAVLFKDPSLEEIRDIPVPIRSHILSIYKNQSFKKAREVLTSFYDENGVTEKCTILCGTERILRAFTEDTKKKFPRGFDSHLTTVVSYGQYITKKWRNIFCDYWNVQLIDKYGLSEVLGGATQSPSCEWYFFDPIVIPEVIGYRSREPLKEGKGILLLTSLYPFQEVQPFVRYYTGDLVEVTFTNSSQPGRMAIKPLGRAEYGVPMPTGDQWILSPAEIYEYVDSLEDIERLPLFLDAKQIKIPNNLGHPIYTIKYSYVRDVISISLSICFKNYVHDNKRNSILISLKKSLCNSNSLISHLLKEDKIKISCFSDESITADVISYPT